MPKTATKKRAVDDYESDDGFVQDAPKSKKTKSVSSGKQLDDEDNPYWEISKQRRIQVTDFKGTTMVGIREFYEKDGKTLPGKKGISLSIDQFTAFLQTLPEIEKELRKRGKDVPRPNYSAAQDDGDGEVSEHEEEDADRTSQDAESGKGKSSKANYEGTSDEDED